MRIRRPSAGAQSETTATRRSGKSRSTRLIVPSLLMLGSMMPASAQPVVASANGGPPPTAPTHGSASTAASGGAADPLVAAVAADPEAGVSAHDTSPPSPAVATPAPAQPPATAVPAVGATLPAGPSTGANGPAVAQATPAPPAPAAPPPELAGDRADAIARDVVEHPPQKQAVRQDASRLRIAGLKLGGLLDRAVHGSENSDVGRVIDVMIGDDGKLAALELDVGGFMGVGNRKIAVAWSLFDVPKPTGTEPLRVALTEEQVRSAPAAEESGNVTVVTGADMAPVAVVKPAPPSPPVSGAADAPAAPGGSPSPATAPPAPPAAATQDAPKPVQTPATPATPAPVAPPTRSPRDAAAPAEQRPASHPPGQP